MYINKNALFRNMRKIANNINQSSVSTVTIKLNDTA